VTCPATATQVLEHIQRDGIETLVIVPLYPHFSLSTSGSSLKLLNSVFEKYAMIAITD
jgi:ferrochelatase